ncbi:MAG: ABC transporter ATP-binding protein, partial [Verrucomicrobiota bacterium]
MAKIEFDGVSKIYSDGTQAVYDLDLAIEDGELMVLVGPSGCGKTTALRMVAGLEEITDGELWIGDQIVNDLTPKERNIAMVFQSYALYPHMTVEDNLAFSLKLHKMPKKEVAERVQRAANILQIEEFLKRKPRALSGGQRQRVAMGRAIVREPEAFLMDEPLSNLDAKLRVQMRAEIHQLQRRLDVTTIYVTHDQVEAMTMGDRVAVMNAGRLQQVDTPQVLYDQPKNEFVAGFIGSPAINLVEAQLEQANGHLAVAFGEHRLTVDDRAVRNRAALKDYVGRTVILGIRPENFEDASIEPDAPSDRRIRALCELTEPLGAEVLVHVGTAATGVVSSAATADA